MIYRIDPTERRSSGVEKEKATAVNH